MNQCPYEIQEPKGRDLNWWATVLAPCRQFFKWMADWVWARSCVCVSVCVPACLWEGEREWECEEIIHPLVQSPWLQLPKLEWSEARKKEILLALPLGRTGSRTYAIFYSFLRSIGMEQIESGATGTPTVTHVGYQNHKWQLYLLGKGRGPSGQFSTFPFVSLEESNVRLKQPIVLKEVLGNFEIWINVLTL